MKKQEPMSVLNRLIEYMAPIVIHQNIKAAIGCSTDGDEAGSLYTSQRLDYVQFLIDRYRVENPQWDFTRCSEEAALTVQATYESTHTLLLVKSILGLALWLILINSVLLLTLLPLLALVASKILP